MQTPGRRMLKKIMKHTLRTLAVLLLAVLLLPALLYVPAVQDLVRRKAAAYASQALGMELSVAADDTKCLSISSSMM